MTEQEICEQFVKTMQRMERVGDSLFSDKLTHNEFIALCILSEEQKKQNEEQGIYVSMLASGMQSSTPAVSRLLRAMEEKGLIERKVDRKDRRNTFVSITEEGQVALKEKFAWMGDVFMNAVHRIGFEKMESMLTLLEDFASEMEEKIKEMKQHV